VSASSSSSSAKTARNKSATNEDKDAIDKNGECRYFLIKSEPDSRIENDVDVKFSIDDLQAKGVSPWDGVR
jgi:hypothetical protein